MFLGLRALYARLGAEEMFIIIIISSSITIIITVIIIITTIIITVIIIIIIITIIITVIIIIKCRVQDTGIRRSQLQTSSGGPHQRTAIILIVEDWHQRNQEL